MSKLNLSETDAAMLALLKPHEGQRAAWLGERLWAKNHDFLPANCSCPFARPAGRVLHRLKRLGLASIGTDGWRRTYGGTYWLKATGRETK